MATQNIQKLNKEKSFYQKQTIEEKQKWLKWQVSLCAGCVMHVRSHRQKRVERTGSS